MRNSRYDDLPSADACADRCFASKRAFAVTSAGIEGGKNLAESAQDLERTRKAINVQLAEFDGVKKSLMRDLQNRCEKVGFNTQGDKLFYHNGVFTVYSLRSSNWKSSWTKSRSSTIM